MVMRKHGTLSKKYHELLTLNQSVSDHSILFPLFMSHVYV